MKKYLAVLGLISFVIAPAISFAGLEGFSGVTEVNRITSTSPSELYEVTYHIKKGWNFLPYPILNGRDAETGKSSCWKQDDQRGNIQATNLDYVYMYEPNTSTLPNNRVSYYVGGKTEEWNNEPLSSYKKSIWSIPEPNKKMTLPINWVYSDQNCDFSFRSRWIDTENYKETSDALKGGNIPCTSDYCPLKLEKGWQVVLQLFPGFTWNEIKGDCVIEEINFWSPSSQSYTVGDQEKQNALGIFMSARIEKGDYFKPIMMKVQNTCMLKYNSQ